MGILFTSILTGDIVNSRQERPDIWLKQLKKILKIYGKRPNQWDIFRGDMFQLEIEAEKSLEAAIRIKAYIKQDKHLDVRIAIGIGKAQFKGKRIPESNGEAFINSGECFEQLNKNRLALQSPWPTIDEEWGLYLQLASLTMDQWAPMTASILSFALANPTLTQKQIAKKLKRTQSNISRSLNRAGYEEIENMTKRFRHTIQHQITQQ